MLEEFKKLHPNFVYSHDDFMLGIDPIEAFINEKELDYGVLEHDYEYRFNSDDRVTYYDEFGFEIYKPPVYEILKWAMYPNTYSRNDDDYYKIYAFDWNKYRTYHASKYHLDHTLKDFGFPDVFENACCCLHYINEDILDSEILQGKEFYKNPYFSVELEMYHYINENFHPFIEDSPEWFDEDKDIWINKMSA